MPWPRLVLEYSAPHMIRLSWLGSCRYYWINISLALGRGWTDMRLFVTPPCTILCYIVHWDLDTFSSPLGLKISHYVPSYVLRNQDPRDNDMEALISIDRALLASLILILCKWEKHDKLMTQAFPLHPSSFRFRFANFLLWTKGFRFQPLHQTGIDKQFKAWLFCWAEIFQTPFPPEPARAGGVRHMMSPAPLNWVGRLSWQVATSRA